MAPTAALRNAVAEVQDAWHQVAEDMGLKRNSCVDASCAGATVLHGRYGFPTASIASM